MSQSSADRRTRAYAMGIIVEEARLIAERHRGLHHVPDLLSKMIQQAQDQKQWCDRRDEHAWNRRGRQASDVLRVVEVLETIAKLQKHGLSLSAWDEPLPSEAKGSAS